MNIKPEGNKPDYEELTAQEILGQLNQKSHPRFKKKKIHIRDKALRKGQNPKLQTAREKK